MRFGKTGWTVIVFSFIAMFANGLIHTNGINVLFPALQEVKGWSVASLLSMNSIASIVGVFFTLVTGWLIVKFGCRKVSGVSFICGGIAVALMGMANTIAALAACFVLLYCTADAFGQMSPSTLVAQWLPEKKGIALGIATVGYPVCSIIAVPLLITMMSMLSLSGLFICVGVFYVVMGVISLVVVRDPDLGTTQARGHKVPWKCLLSSRSTWLISCSMGMLWAATIGLLSQMIPFLTSIGFEMGDATLMLQLASGCGLLGSLLSGVIDDNLGTKRTCLLLAVIYVLVFSLLAFGSENTVIVRFAVVLGGLGTGSICNLLPSLVSTVFGFRDFAIANSAISPIAGIFRSTSFAVLSIGLAISGAYQFGYGIFAVYSIVSVVMLIALEDCRVNQSDKTPSEAC